MKTPNLRSIRTFAAGGCALLMLAAAACDSSTGPVGSEAVNIRFSATTDAASGSSGGSLVVSGTNGTLEITSLRVIVAELEFEGTNGACSSSSDDSDEDCFEVELPPRLVSMPLNGAPLSVATTDLPAGTYSEFELEIEDLEDDESDTAFAQEIAELEAQIRATFPDWPEKGTIRVEGTFTPTGGTAESFVTYVDAEVELELDLVPFIEITGTDDTPHTLDVTLFPDRWFVRGDGTVVDLTEFDYPSTGDLLEIEVEIENGFEVEFDED